MSRDYFIKIKGKVVKTYEKDPDYPINELPIKLVDFKVSLSDDLLDAVILSLKEAIEEKAE